jgi:hypothetical protein
MDEIQQIVASFVKDRLKGVSIESVAVEPDVDNDGDRALKITVIYDLGKGASLDSSKLVGMVRHLKPQLLGEHGNDFPLFRFLSKMDAAKLKNEAA